LLAMLQRSTLLAQQIESLQRSQAAAQVALHEAQRQLAEACARSTKDLEQWSGGRADAEARGSLQDSVAQLAKDCAGGSVAKEDPMHTSVPAATLQASPSDDAQRLRQKADFLRDREDRLRRQVIQLDQRIQAMNRERALQHRMAEFLQENSLFDEDDRRVARAEVPVVPGAATAGKVEPAAVSTFAPAAVQSTGAAAATSTTTGVKTSAADSVGGPPAVPSPTLARSSVLQRPEGPPVEGSIGGPDESLEGLSARRAILAA